MKRNNVDENIVYTQYAEPVNHGHGKIVRYLKTLHFRPRLFGVDQQDVWKKIETLNAMYEVALSEERARYDALLGAALTPAAQPEEEGVHHEKCG